MIVSSIFPFETILTLSILGVLLLIGFILRAKIVFLQKFFVPACITAGIIGLFLKEIGFLPISKNILETLVYHIFNITFISLGLSPRTNRDSNRRKEELRGILIMGLLIASVAALQFIIGGLLTVLFNLFGYNLFPTFGFLVTMGFEEGPGQALSIGKTWENLGFVNASTVGLSFATIGFMFAIFLGVPLVSWMIYKGYTNSSGEKLPSSFITGVLREKEPAGFQTTHPSTLDSLTFHFSLIGLVYLLTYGFLRLLEKLLPSDLAEMYWGFFFIWGLLIAYILKVSLEKMKLDYMLDAGLQSRITGWSVDILVTGAITAISIQVVWMFIIPIAVISIVSGVLTLLWILYFGKKLWERYKFERIAGLYGMETGTIATGLILVRIADPRFDTPAAIDLAVGGIVALPLMFLMMHLMNAPILLGWNLTITTLSFILILGIIVMIFGLISMKKK
ncbi:MAG TPA: hypothetical protein ENI44_02035 [Thermoplasmatales archaeon]|nr:hypothetical protein [Thermoplasmatales archaeon]